MTRDPLPDSALEHLTLRVLGGFQIDAPGAAVRPMPSRKAQALVAYLAQRGGQPVPRAKLAPMLWSEGNENEARHSLRQCLLVIRKALGQLQDLLVIDADTIAFGSRADSVDATRFERLVQEGSEDSLREAIRLYRGEFLEGLSLGGEPMDEWVIFERKRLSHVMTKALTALIRICESRGREDEAIDLATRLLATDPTHADVQHSLTALYARRRGDAPALVPRRPLIIVAVPTPRAERLAARLSEGGFDPVVARDYVDVLLEAGASRAQAIVLDPEMALPDGGPLLEMLASRRPSLPVIGISETADEEGEARFLARGARDFLRGPLQPDVLFLRLRRAIEPR